jgi:hypothetical protein
MLGIDYVQAYLVDVLVLMHSDWKDHIAKLDLVFEWIQEAGLKVNAVTFILEKMPLNILAIG